MSELNTSTQSDFTKAADIIFMDELQAVPQVARTSGLFKVVSIPANSGDTREFSEIDLELYATIKDEGDQAQRAQVQQGFSKTMSVDRFGKDIGITYEMRTRNKYPEVIARLTNIARLVPQRQELDLQHRIGFGTATTYTNKEGNTVTISTGETTSTALFDSTHDLRGSSTTYRNILANNPRLSKGALEGMERLVTENTYNQMGEKMTMSFDILFTTDDPNTVNTAREYLQSTADVEGANSGVTNVYKAKYRHVVLPLVATNASGAPDTDKRYYWGIASSQMSSAYLGVWEEPHFLPPADLGKDSTEDWQYGVRGGYGIVIVSGSFIKFSKGDGAA